MMRDIKVSVITPLYNSEYYLREAIECILNQTLKDIELIIIDDGSTDGTNAIVRSYSDKDDRIVFLENNNNLGAAVSRNRAMKISKGKYFAFLDGDDVFLPELLERLYLRAEECEAQIVLCDYIQEYSKNINIVKFINHSQSFVEKYCRGTYQPSRLSFRDYKMIRTSLGGFFVRNSFVKENGIQFQDIRSSNDVYFTLFLQMIAEKVVWLQDEKVMWIQRIHNTKSRISSHRNLMDEYNALIKVGYCMHERFCSKEASLLYAYRCIMYFIFNIKDEADADYKNNYYRFIRNDGIYEVLRISGLEGTEYYREFENLFIEFEKEGFSNEWLKKWYDKNFGIEWCICNKLDELTRILSAKEVVLWGAGHNGEILENIFYHSGLKIKAVVDSDDGRIGKLLGAHKVYKTDIIDSSDFIVVTPNNCKEIVQRCVEMGNDYLCLVDYIDFAI